MNRILTILFLFISLTIQATTYYIDPAGNNANNGSIGAPLLTLTYACSQVTTSGDIIHVNTGTYIETEQSLLAVGVSIEGEGNTSIIKSHYATSGGDDAYYGFTIYLASTSEGTNGNQHISNIKMDGDNLTAYGAIRVYRRSNVEINNCMLIDFNYCGVSFVGGYSQASEPTIYATGNSFHDNTVTNCSGYFPHGDKNNGEGKGALLICGQQTMLIYNNNLDQTSRAEGYNGYLIKGVGGFLKDVKIYNNIITRESFGGTTWDFALELWNIKGGVEIYDNTITGSVDIVIAEKETYTYATYIHNNTIGQTTLGQSNSAHGILLELSTSDIVIEKNYIKNVCMGIYFQIGGSSRTVNNVGIYYNIFNNIGVSDDGDDYNGRGINWYYDNNTNTVSNINIWNNIFIGHIGTKHNLWGIELPTVGTATYISIRNNIIKDFNGYAAIWGTGGTGITIDHLSIENNDFYNNNYNNLPKYVSLTPTNNITQNNMVSDPLFMSTSDFFLSNDSPLLDAGIKVGLTTDYSSHSIVDDKPDIGAFEYVHLIMKHGGKVIKLH
jgi:hypothetical protein